MYAVNLPEQNAFHAADIFSAYQESVAHDGEQ